MEPTEQSCDTTQIDDYLAGRLPIERQSEFEAHLTECEACRQLLEEHAAEADVWDNARSLLSLGYESAIEDDDGETTTGEDAAQPGIMVLDALAPTDDPEMLGRLGEYEISGVVGVGGMGAVLRGFDKSLRRVVAIKVMAPHLAGSGPARTRFQREARAAAAITHDNIIEIYGVAEANRLPYIVMPYARGPSLQNRIDRSGPLTAVEAVRIGKQIAAGLAAAHEQGLVHRDIKPANILLNEGIERLWITDFGVARAMDDASMTKTGLIAGTPQYMSPEQARGESVDHRSDLFSLGSVLYTACTGRAPFRSEAAYGILRRITDTDPRPIRELNPDVPEWLCQIIGRLMAKHPGDRFQTAGEVADLLEGCLAHLQQPTRVAMPPCLAAPDSPTREQTRPHQHEVVQPQTQKPSALWTRVAVAFLAASLLLAMMGAVVWQATAPVDITGTWKGEDWATVSLSSVDEATGWYNGTFTDDQGRRGAVQLEWSRVQRRYNGRWKSGDDQSGSITLRAGDAEEVRGAVSADPESTIRPEAPRLRQFSWRRTDLQPLVVSIDKLPERRERVGTPQSITSPEKGVIVRISEGVRENVRLKKGELIAVLAPLSADGRMLIESELVVAEQQVDLHRSAVSAKSNAIKVAMTNFDAFKQRKKSFERVQHEIVAGAEAAIAVEENKVEAAESQLAAMQASVDQFQKVYDRKKEIVEKGLVSREELQTAEAQLKAAQAKMAAAEASVRSANNERLIKEKDRNAKEARAQVDIDEAEASARNAQTELSEAEAELAMAQSNLVKAEGRVKKLQLKLQQEDRLNIFAPRDGYITGLASVGQAVKQGDVLFQLWPDEVPSEQTRQPSPLRDEQRSATSTASDASILQSLPPRGGDAAQRWIPALETALSLAERVRQCQNQLQAAEATRSTNPGDTESLQRSLDRLRGQRSTLNEEKATITKLIQTRLSAADELQKYQSDLTKQMAAAAAVGKITEHDLTLAKYSLVKANGELKLLSQLLEFYQAIDKADVALERKTIIEILKSQIATAQELHDLQSTITQRITFAFERGRLTLDETLEARKSLAAVASEMRELELLLDHYTNLSVANGQPDQDNGSSKKGDAATGEQH